MKLLTLVKSTKIILLFLFFFILTSCGSGDCQADYTNEINSAQSTYESAMSDCATNESPTDCMAVVQNEYQVALQSAQQSLQDCKDSKNVEN